MIEKLRVVLASGSDEECAVCLDSVRLPVITHCAHVYCRPCITQVISTEQVPRAWRRRLRLHGKKNNVFLAFSSVRVQERARCPLCRGEIKTSELVEFPPEELKEDKSRNNETWRTSSKVPTVGWLIQL